MNIEVLAPIFASVAALFMAFSISVKRATVAFIEYKLRQAEHERETETRRMDHDREIEIRRMDHELEMEKVAMERTERMVRHTAQSTEAIQQHTSVIADLHKVVAGLADKYESGRRTA